MKKIYFFFILSALSLSAQNVTTSVNNPSGRLRLISGITLSLNEPSAIDQLGTLYPNPIERLAYVDLISNMVVSDVCLHSMDGKVLQAPFLVGNDSLEIDLQEIPSGFISWRSLNKRDWNLKCIDV